METVARDNLMTTKYCHAILIVNYYEFSRIVLTESNFLYFIVENVTLSSVRAVNRNEALINIVNIRPFSQLHQLNSSQHIPCLGIVTRSPS